MKPRPCGLHHDHIDGSAAMATVIEDLYQLAGKPFPFANLSAWSAFFQDPLQDMVAKFGTVTSVLQSAEALELAGVTYGLYRSAQGYAYLEAKFAPQYHVFGGLTLRQATDAMIRGLRRAERKTGIIILPQLCIGREATPELGMEVAKIAVDYGGEVALDMACDEAGHPPEKHLPAYQLTFGTAVRRDCHAGEWVSPEPAATYRERLIANIRTAVRVLRCDGIGHAIPLIHDLELVREMADRGIRVSGCPGSYVHLGLIKNVRELGIDRLLDMGVRYTLNPDDDLFLPSMPYVLGICDLGYGFTAEQARALEDNVILAAFDRRVRY